MRSSTAMRPHPAVFECSHFPNFNRGLERLQGITDLLDLPGD
jgi:hypothetical protein